MAALLFAAVAQGPSGLQVEASQRIVDRANGLEDRLLRAASGGQEVDPERVEADLSQVEADAAILSASDPELLPAMAEWRESVRSWLEREAGGPGGERSLAAMVHARRLLAGRARRATTYARPAWVDRALPWARWMLVPSGALSLLIVGLAWGLQGYLGRPLEALARAADRVAGGRLDAPLPVPAGGPELRTVTRAVGAMRDRLLEAIERAQSSAAEVEAMLAGLDDGLLLVDSEGRVAELNRAAGEMLARLGTAAPARRGVALATLLPEADGAGEQAKDIGHRGLEITLKVHPLRLPGERPGHLVILRDVTAEREAEAVQRDFLSVVTHELKTPLTAIEGYALLLLRGKGGGITERQRGFLRTVHQQAEVLRGMIQNLLDASRIESGRLPVEKRPIEVSGWLSRLAETWSGAVQAAGLELKTRIGAMPEGCAILADPARLDQVFGNLLGNAVKFTPAGGVVELGARVAGTELQAWVQDDGPGIPRDQLGRVFDRFHQVHRGDTRLAGGAGLGLYIARQLLRVHGGEIRAISDPGHGSRFEITIPIMEAPP